MVAITGCSLVVLFMHKNKSLNHHPNKLIYYMCLSEAICCYSCVVTQVNAKDFICYLKLEKLFSLSLGGYLNEEKALATLVNTNCSFLQFFEYCSLVLNFFYCLDLMLTLKSPFYPHDRRMKWYLSLSPILAGVLVLITSDKTQSHNVFSFYIESIAGCTVITIYILFAIFSCAYNYRIGMKPGMSPEIRQQCIYRHIFYVIVYQLTWMPYLALTYYALFLSSEHKNLLHLVYLKGTNEFDNMQTLLTVNVYCSLLSGIFLSIVRCTEPVFLHRIKVSVYEFWGEIYD